ILLTVQSQGNGKYRLGVNVKDSREIFKRRYRQVCLILEELNVRTKTTCVKTKTTCGLPDFEKEHIDVRKKKGYDLSDKKINEWIQSNKFQCYNKSTPTKLEFEIIKISEEIKLKFTGNVKNMVCRCNCLKNKKS